MKNTRNTASATALCCVVLAGVALAQITDPEQAKSWYFLQKLVQDLSDLQQCALVVTGTQLDADAKRYLNAAENKTVLFNREADAYIQRYRTKNESLEAFRFRVWAGAIRSGTESARPMEKLNTDFCATLLILNPTPSPPR